MQRSAEAFAGRKQFLHYGSVLGPEERIEVDVNYLLRLPLGEPRIAELWRPGELDRPRLSIVGDEELVIGKLCALLDPCAARDVWDAAHLRSQVAAALGLPTFRGRFLALAGTLDHSPDTYTQRRLAERATQREFDEQLVPVLAAGVEVHAAELVGAACPGSRLLALTPGERAFVDELHRGDLDLSLLFPGDAEEAEEAERLSAHAALRWKAQNARSHHDRR